MHETNLKVVVAHTDSYNEPTEVEIVETFMHNGSTFYMCIQKLTGRMSFVKPMNVIKIISYKDDLRGKLAEQSTEMVEAIKNMFGGVGEVAETDIPFE